jgi:hypothetical protein
MPAPAGVALFKMPHTLRYPAGITGKKFKKKSEQGLYAQ